MVLWMWSCVPGHFSGDYRNGWLFIWCFNPQGTKSIFSSSVSNSQTLPLSLFWHLILNHLSLVSGIYHALSALTEPPFVLGSTSLACCIHVGRRTSLHTQRTRTCSFLRNHTLWNPYYVLSDGVSQIIYASLMFISEYSALGSEEVVSGKVLMSSVYSLSSMFP